KPQAWSRARVFSLVSLLLKISGKSRAPSGTALMPAVNLDQSRRSRRESAPIPAAYDSAQTPRNASGRRGSRSGSRGSAASQRNGTNRELTWNQLVATYGENQLRVLSNRRTKNKPHPLKIQNKHKK